MTSVILDASAVLAYLRRERGADRVEPRLTGASISTVNYSEIVQKGIAAGASLDEVQNAVDLLQLMVVPFSKEQAVLAAELWRHSRAIGLSLADRCSLSLAQLLGQPVLTADKDWMQLRNGVEIEVIR